MQQLIQSLKDGKMELLEAPYPSLNHGCILVRNHFSVISAGTEGKTVKDARLGYIGKAKARKDEVKKVVHTAQTMGMMKTYRMVMNKLEAPSALGYSCAGEVIDVAENIHDIRIGDYVTCGGNSAVHAEVVSVPRNLCALVDESVPLKNAAFATIGAIAMQGVRQSELTLGENCVVIGLGLVGQLTMQILEAGGINAIGIDISREQVDLANRIKAGSAFNRNDDGLDKIIYEKTNGHGTDAVIITAASSSSDPIEFSGMLCRKKGKVIIVGAVPTGFSRKNYYVKELDLRMSSSYGPGRHDLSYEEKGIDYPIGYVRWTENRNMQAFIKLLQQKKLDIDSIITHQFKFEDASDAYQMIVEKKTAFSGIVLKYNIEKKLESKLTLFKRNGSQSSVTVGFIGAGSFAQNILLPVLKGEVDFVGITTARANNARNVANKYGFRLVTGQVEEVLENKEINTIFITTRHNLHAPNVLKALANNKNVYVEKPLCMNMEELTQITNAYAKSSGKLMVGYNRRFSELTKKVKREFNAGLPKAINYRINAGIVPKEHWVHDPEIGGGRILGEVCHFIDLCMFIAGSAIKSLSAKVMKTADNLQDTLTINLEFENNSIAQIGYFSNGGKSLSKEYLEVFSAGKTAIIDDFKTMSIHGTKTSKTKLSAQDKGYKNEMSEFINSISQGRPEPIPFEETIMSTLATFKVLESIKAGGKNIMLQDLQI